MSIDRIVYDIQQNNQSSIEQCMIFNKMLEDSGKKLRRMQLESKNKKIDTIKQEKSLERKVCSSKAISYESIINEKARNLWHTTNKITIPASKTPIKCPQQEACAIFQHIKKQINFACKLFSKKQVVSWLNHHFKSIAPKIQCIFGIPFRIDSLFSQSFLDKKTLMMLSNEDLSQLQALNAFLQKMLIKKQQRKMASLQNSTTNNMIALQQISQFQNLPKIFERGRQQPTDINNFMQDLADMQRVHGRMGLIGCLNRATFEQILTIEKGINNVKESLREKVVCLNDGFFYKKPLTVY